MPFSTTTALTCFLLSFCWLAFKVTFLVLEKINGNYLSFAFLLSNKSHFFLILFLSFFSQANSLALVPSRRQLVYNTTFLFTLSSVFLNFFEKFLFFFTLDSALWYFFQASSRQLVYITTLFFHCQLLFLAFCKFLQKNFIFMLSQVLKQPFHRWYPLLWYNHQHCLRKLPQPRRRLFTRRVPKRLWLYRSLDSR